MVKQLELWDPVPPPRETVVVPHRQESSTVRSETAAGPAVSVSDDPAIDFSCSPAEDRTVVLQRLRQQIRHTEMPLSSSWETVSCGAESLDRLLPQGGLPRGAMSEWVVSAAGLGASWLSLTAAAEALRSSPPGKALVVLDRDRTFYPPAVKPLGISTSQIILLRPTSHADMVWAADQALRSPAVAAVWGPLGKELDDRDARRLQLAAETGHTMALFVRPATVLGAPSFAAVRWHVRGLSASPAGRRLHVELARCRGGVSGHSVTVTIAFHSGTIQQADSRRVQDREHHEQHPWGRQPAAHTYPAAAMHLVSQLADPAVASRARDRAKQKHSA